MMMNRSNGNDEPTLKILLLDNDIHSNKPLETIFLQLGVLFANRTEREVLWKLSVNETEASIV